MNAPPPVVAVLNSNDDTVELLRICLEHQGFDPQQIVTAVRKALS